MIQDAEELQRQIKDAPDLSGVYLFRGPDSVLYVGKALSLRKRLSSYLRPARGATAQRAARRAWDMMERAESIEWIVTSGEVEALLLENNLIKKHRPQFNIRLRDDKSYPYIVITMEEEFPRVMLTRQPHRKGNLYFGPYANAAKVRETLDALGRIFPFRKCRGGSPGRRSGSPCLQYAIQRCEGPCDGLVSSEQYREVTKQVASFLSGRETEIARGLERQMREAAAAMEFEKAALYRNRLEAVRHVLERQQATSGRLGSVDIIGMAFDEHGANAQVFLTRDGALGDRRSFTFVNTEGVTKQEVFEQFVGEYYASVLLVPPEILVPRFVRNMEHIASFLQGLRGAKVTLRHAERGDGRRLQKLAERNAALALEHDRLRAERTRQRTIESLVSLREILGLRGLPMRIEGYDVSNLGSEAIVASMVVFQGGKPRKSDYRKFAIEGTEGQDDVAALREALKRRFSRGVAVGQDAAYDPSFEAVPDLVVVDGGKGQLGAARATLDQVGLGDAVPVISLAKREEEVFAIGHPEPLRLGPDDPARLLLQRLRDEAHRFAVSFHRARRQAKTTDSIIDTLPGVGEKRKRSILKHFGSPDRFLEATREEMEAVPGLPGKVARDIHEYLHKTG